MSARPSGVNGNSSSAVAVGVPSVNRSFTTALRVNGPAAK
jgi:hypothetical protein